MKWFKTVLLTSWVVAAGMACGVGVGQAAEGVSQSRATSPQAVQTIDASGFTTDERLTAVCLQGLLNRRGAKVFLNFGATVDTTILRDHLGESGPIWSRESHAALTNRFGSVYDIWIDELTKAGLYKFEPATLEGLLLASRDELKGVILYGTVDDDLAVAANLAALRSAVPMTPAVYSKRVTDKGIELPTLFDVRALHASYDPAQPKRLEAHRWAVSNLLAACNHAGAFSRDRTYGLDAHDMLIDMDLAVQQRYLMFNLNFLSPETKNPNDRPHPIYGFDLPDTALLNTILNGLDRFSPVYGWGSPDENNFVRRLSLHDCAAVCALNGNSSFFKRMRPMTSSFAQVRPGLEKVRLENKIYVAFMINEGDSLKCHATLGNQAGWMQPERGRVPINWGMDPYLHEAFPGLISYYYATATTNDYFFAAASGWGYAHPDRMPANSLIPYARQVCTAGSKANLSYIDIWWMSSLREKKVFFPFLKETGMRGLTQWSDRQAVEYSPLDGTPIIHSYDYYTLLQGDPAKFADALIQEAGQVKVPWFIVIYGGWPYKFCEVARRLPVEQFKVVTLNEFFEAAREARPQVEGRVWKRANLMKAAAPGAGQAQTP